jgi:hypothetical protein
MTDVFLERIFDPPITARDILEMASDADWCFKAHRVNWRGSFLGSGGRRLVCWFRGPDAESIRLALDGADLTIVWAGTAYGGNAAGTPNVIAAHRFAQPLRRDELETLEQTTATFLHPRGVAPWQTFLSLDRQRMLNLYVAPDPETVRTAQSQAGIPTEAVWAIERVGPEELTSFA